jgi:selenocysteine lyase/cysteine desulfurase
MINVDRVRADTPGVQHRIHLNNCGAALMPQPVIDTVINHLQREATIGAYEAADQAIEQREQVYSSIARLIGGAVDEIAIVENATRGWDMAFFAFPWARGDRILTSTVEYGSNFIPFLQVAQRHGVVVEVVPEDAHGQLDVVALEGMLDDRVRLIAVTHVPTHGGLVNPAADIGGVAQRHGIPFMLDACQSVGQLPVDVNAWGVDVLSATSRKYLRGPRGVGFLYVRRELGGRLEPPFLDVHAAHWEAHDRFRIRADARRFENWEQNIAGILGLGVAVDYALSLGLEPIAQRITALANELRSRLRDVDPVVVQDRGAVQCGIVSFSVGDLNPAEVVTHMRSCGINLSVSRASSTRIDMDRRGLAAVVRAGVHYYNTSEELERFVDVLRPLCA